MTLKKLDDPASKDFWDYVEKSKQEWREQQPAWSRELEQREAVPQNEGGPSVNGVSDRILCN